MEGSSVSSESKSDWLPHGPNSKICHYDVHDYDRGDNEFITGAQIRDHGANGVYDGRGVTGFAIYTAETPLSKEYRKAVAHRKK